MTAQSQEVRVWRRARTKFILSKRTDFHEMDYNDNGFDDSYFVDDDDQDDAENDRENDNSAMETCIGEDEDDKMSGHELRLGSFSNDEFNHKLLTLEGATNDGIDSSSFDTFFNRVGGRGEHNDADDFQTNVDKSNIEVDYVDTGVARVARIAVSRPPPDLKTDQLDFDQGDQPQRREKHGPKNGKNVRDKKRPRFIPSVKFGWFDLLVGVLSICLFFVDIGTDIELAVHYFRNSLWMYGGVTTGLIVVPSLVTCFLGLHWYIIDFNKEREILHKQETLGNKDKAYQTPNYVWFVRFFFTLIQCGPAMRVIEYLYCGYKSRCKQDEQERKRYYLFMLYEDVDSCLLRLFESFLEAAPQLTWQLYIVIDLKPKEDAAGSSIRALAMLSSWASLAISLTSYHKSLRNSHKEKAKMTLKSLPLYFIWRACETGGRMLCIAMFASAFRLWVFGPLVFHWAFMSGWLIMQRTSFYKNKCMEKVFNIICGYVMIFCFLNLREGQTRFRFLLFYFILYAENFIMLALWFRFTKDLGAWFHLWGFIVVLLLFVFHVTFQLLYYTFLHPTKNIKICLPCTRYVICSSICYEVQPRIPISDDRSERLSILEVVGEDTLHQNVENS